MARTIPGHRLAPITKHDSKYVATCECGWSCTDSIRAVVEQERSTHRDKAAKDAHLFTPIKARHREDVPCTVPECRIRGHRVWDTSCTCGWSRTADEGTALKSEQLTHRAAVHAERGDV